jgi:Skp family chaperone for outer membrane proteins
MLKKLIVLFALITFTSNLAQANVKKVAVVDVQKVVNKSAQVQALKKEQQAKQANNQDNNSKDDDNTVNADFEDIN